MAYAMGLELQNPSLTPCGMDNVSFSDRELVFRVRDALKAVHSGDSEDYNMLLAVMHQREFRSIDQPLLETSLKSLCGAVADIDSVSHQSLLSAIFGMNMWNYRPSVMDALIDLLVSLAVSSAKYLDSCLDALVYNFLPPNISAPYVVTKKQHVISRVHRALEEIAKLVPRSPLRLLQIVIERIPSIYKTDESIVLYVENMLKLESGPLGEIVGSTMIMAVVDRLLELDVEIGWDESQDNSSKGIFEMELQDMDGASDDEELDGIEGWKGSLKHKNVGGKMVTELLGKLMVLTFKHLESCKASGRLIEVFETLLKSFELTVMNAYKSKFSQFVVFYACCLDSENCGVRFPTRLADIFLSSTIPHTRMSAVAYLASYLSRARFMSDSFIVGILSRLVDWCLKYCQVRNDDVNPKAHRNVNPEAHRVFYSGCQAIMYVLCFRMKSMLANPQLKTKIFSMPLTQILQHKINPLQVCLPCVVEEFLKQAKAASLFTVSETFIFNDLLESEQSMAYGGRERLDMFFPFDPCSLMNPLLHGKVDEEKFSSFIQPYYVFWWMVRTPYNDSDSEEEEADDLLVENFTEGATGMSFDDEFNFEMNKMSITPKTSFGFNKSTRMPSRIRASASPESL